MKKAFLAVIAVIVVLAGKSRKSVPAPGRSDPESRQHGKKLHEA